MKRRGAAGKDAVFALNFNREDGPHFIFARNDPPLFCTRDSQATSQQYSVVIVRRTGGFN